MKTNRIFLCLLAFLPLLGGCVKKTAAVSYEFTAVSLGSLEKTVSSSGSLNPVSTVKVLPRMSGKVERVYVDYNDEVRAGDILAELNTDMLRLQREQQLAAVIKARANHELQQVNYRSQVKLAEKNLISEYELKTSKTSLDSQAAELAAAEASLRVIETEINQYAFITSPINGIVLERNISPGDTVVEGSSSNSTSIFTLAENLTEMQIEAGVGELDVASIYKGQDVRFTLESLPGRTFSGTVETLRLIPSVQNSVVSYTVIVNVKNQDGSLLPGMTCAVEFIEEQRSNILIVPNAALRYQPTNISASEIADMVFNAGLAGMSEEQRTAAAEARTRQQSAQASGQAASSTTGLAGLVTGGGPAMGGMMGGRGGGPGGAPGGAPGGGVVRSGSGASGGTTGGAPAGGTVAVKNLWYIDSEGKPAVVQVRTGITNGTYTEIRSGENLEGMQVILREKV